MLRAVQQRQNVSRIRAFGSVRIFGQDGVPSAMWRLSHEKRVALIRCLVEGNPMRATARICGVGLNTVVRLLREIGPLADQYHHENVFLC